MSAIGKWAGADPTPEEKAAKQAAKKQANKDAKREAMTAYKRKEKEYEKAAEKARSPNATKGDHEAAAKLAKEAHAAGRALQVHKVSGAVAWRIHDIGNAVSTHEWNADKAKSAEAKTAAAVKEFSDSAKDPLKQSGVGSSIKAYAGEGSLFAHSAKKGESPDEAKARGEAAALTESALKRAEKSVEIHHEEAMKAKDPGERLYHEGQRDDAKNRAGYLREKLAKEKGEGGTSDWDESKHPRDEKGQFT